MSICSSRLGLTRRRHDFRGTSIIPKEINVVFPNDANKKVPTNAKLWFRDPDKNYDVNNAIELTIEDYDFHLLLLYYEYSGKKEPQFFNVNIDGIYINSQKVFVPEIRYHLGKDFLIEIYASG